MLRLPTYQLLSKEQDEIHNLPLQGSHLVVGPPGTGKTVLAIYRAEMLKRERQKAQFVVYNNTLNQYLGRAIAETGIRALSSTYHSWLGRWYWRNFKMSAPQVQPFEFDWDRIYRDIGCRTFERYDHFIIDEGQDFPPQFYILMQLICDNITVFADENQKIARQNSTLKDIRDALDIKQTHLLRRNYRNSRPIAEFARTYYAGLESGLPDLPEKRGPKPRVLEAANLESQMKFIARYERNNPDKDIAILVWSNNQQLKIQELLASERLRNPVQLYMSRDEALKRIDFSIRGIKVLTYKSVKGLEFDTVFLPELESCRSKPEDELAQMLFYVLTSRPRQELFLLYSDKGYTPTMLAEVPPGLYDLERI